MAIVIIVGVIGFGVLGCLFMGNMWFTEAGVLRELQLKNPSVVEVRLSKRHVYSSSKITVELKDGSLTNYVLDSNLLFNYELKPAEEKN